MYKIKGSYLNNKEIIINSEDELHLALNGFLQDGDRVVILDSHNHGYLTIGVGKPYGFAQFTNNQDNRPYLITTNPAIEASTENVEFDSGGTITQVPIHYCLEIDTIIEIAVFFFKYGKIPENVYWQEV